MTHQLRLSEKYSRHWPAVMISSLIISLLFLLAYIYSSDPLVGSYLRLGAFAFFVVGFLSYFKLREGQISVLYEAEEDNPKEMTITYTVKERRIHQETVDLAEIEEAKVDDMPNRSLYNDFYKRDKSVRIRKKHMSGWLYLNELHGRMIPFTQENAQKLVDFISKVKPHA